MTFQERSIEFQKELEFLQKKYNVQIYAAIVFSQSGELGPQIKLVNTLPEASVLGDEQKKYDDSEKRGSSDKKTQKITD